jgi:Intracellular proteinase inhibitor
MRRPRGAVLWWGAALFVTPLVTAASQAHPLHLSVVAPDSVRRGASVPITLRLTNTGKQSLNLYLTGRTITFDVVVAHLDGAVVWRRLEGASGQQILQIKTVAPGETVELKAVWNQRTNAGVTAPPGDYTVQGVLPTDGEPLRTKPVRLRIAPSDAAPHD